MKNASAKPETIAFVLNGNLVHFAAFKSHIGFYPAPSGTAKFKKELSVYETGKGSVQFPLDEPIPYDLITKSSSSGSRKARPRRRPGRSEAEEEMS